MSTKRTKAQKAYYRSLKKELKVLGLSNPEHQYGFPIEQLKRELSFYDFKRLENWMEGQTCVADENGDAVWYTEDVVRGLKMLKFGIPTYFD